MKTRVRLLSDKDFFSIDNIQPTDRTSYAPAVQIVYGIIPRAIFDFLYSCTLLPQRLHVIACEHKIV